MAFLKVDMSERKQRGPIPLEASRSRVDSFGYDNSTSCLLMLRRCGLMQALRSWCKNCCAMDFLCLRLSLRVIVRINFEVDCVGVL